MAPSLSCLGLLPSVLEERLAPLRLHLVRDKRFAIVVDVQRPSQAVDVATRPTIVQVLTVACDISVERVSQSSLRW